MVLFDETRELNPQADKTNVALSFTVPPGLTALQVEFTYDPPTPPEPVAVEAVKAALARYARAVVQKDPYAYLPVYNLVTLSLDDPAGYRGAAHRRATEQCHRLTAESASPGFLPGELRPGHWQAVLSAHCVLCPVTCRVRVIGEGTE